jgi:hypothetical protein
MRVPPTIATMTAAQIVPGLEHVVATTMLSRKFSEFDSNSKNCFVELAVEFNGIFRNIRCTASYNMSPEENLKTDRLTRFGGARIFIVAIRLFYELQKPTMSIKATAKKRSL